MLRKDKFSRRQFLKMAGMATCGGAIHRSISPSGSMFAYAFPPSLVASVNSNLVLLVLNLSGGCSYNAVPPYNSAYFDLNRTLARKPDAPDAINLTPEQGLHPALTGLKTLWDAGDLAVVNLVTFPNFTRAHDLDTDKWLLGLPQGAASPSGWAARLTCQMGNSFGGISLAGYNLLVQGDCNPPQALTSLNLGSVAPPGPGWNSGWTRAARETLMDNLTSSNNSESFLNQQSNTLSSIFDLINGPLNFDVTTRYGVQFPDTFIGRMLRDAGKLLATPAVGTRFIYCQQYGYDTHSNEAQMQNTNLSELDNAIKSLVALAKHPQVNRWNDLVIVTMSEFGRTWENASGGTDHGHSGFQLVMGGAVRGGRIVTPAPTAADCVASNGYLRVSHADNRQVFKECVSTMGFDADAVFPSTSFTNLQLFS